MDKDYWTTQAMIMYGGDFVRRLGVLFRFADQNNRQAIKDTWPGYWSDYTKQGLELKASEESNGSEVQEV